MALNVNSDVQDVFYRYKMPPITAKVEGSGNGIKTLIPNMKEVAAALERPPAYPTKFFGCELGAQVQIDDKKERYIVNGAHQAADLQKLLDVFIKKFVLCKDCGNPETRLAIGKKDISQDCIACGYSRELEPHRLTTYIRNNPPAGQAADGKKAGKRTKEERRAAKAGKSIEPAAEEEEKEKAGKSSSSKKAKTPSTADDDDDDDDEWATDANTAAIAERLQLEEVSASVAKLTMSSELELSSDERLDIFDAYVKKDLKLSVERNKAIIAEGERLDIVDKAAIVLCECFWDENIMACLKNKFVVDLLKRFTHENPKAQKHLIGGMEQLIGKHQDLLPKAALILKMLYDTDIVEEGAIISWDSKGPSKRYVSKAFSTKIHETSKKFVTWLKEAEEEEESDEDDDDVEVAFDTGAKEIQDADDHKASKAAAGDKSASAAAATNGGAADDDDDDDDFNIDDI